MITNGSSAEYGRYPAGVVDVVTKSGTNRFQGALFEFFRNESLNAKRWAPPGTTAAKDPLDRNQYGGAFGGPLRQDKTFFFASYSGLRQEETYYRNTAIVPTARERAGDFSQSAIKPRDPLTNAPFAGDLIPGARIDAAALTIQDRFVPAANLPNNFFEVRAPDPLQTDEATFKLDHHLSQTHGIAVSYFFLTGTDTQPLSGSGNIPWVDRDFKWKQHNLNIADTWTLSPTIINQLRVSYMRQFGGRVNAPTTSLGDLNSKFTIQGDPTLPRLTVSGYFTGQVAIAGPDAGSDYFAVKDTLSMSRGNHSFKFGGEVSYEKIVHDTLLDNYGVFSFNGSKTGNAYADFLLGPSRHHDAGCPGAEDRQRRLHQRVRPGRLPHSPARHAEPGRPLRPAVPVHRPRESQARLRSRRAVAGVADGARSACSFQVTPGSAAASSRPTPTTSRRAWGSPGIRGATAGCRCGRRRCVLRQHHRQRMEHDGRQSAIHGAPAVPDGEDAVRSLRQPARRRRSVSVHLQSRPARASRFRRRSSVRRSISSGRTPTR